MKNTISRLLVLSSILFLLTRCELLMIFIEEDQGACERYSIYRSALFGDDLLWEGSACEEECVQLKGKFEEKLEMYNEVYGSGCVYSEHVNYTRDF